MKPLFYHSSYQILCGAINGALVGILMYWLRIQYIASSLMQSEETFERWGGNSPIAFLPRPNLISKTFAFAVLFSVSSFLGVRFFKKLRRNVFLLWPVIGLAAITAWTLFLLIGLGLEYLITGHAEAARFASFNEFYFGPSSFIVVLSFNLMYGCIIRLLWLPLSSTSLP